MIQHCRRAAVAQSQRSLPFKAEEWVAVTEWTEEAGSSVNPPTSPALFPRAMKLQCQQLREEDERYSDHLGNRAD
ncbi:hypothetical protein AOLI_G00027540 [Acnodon oligacanthus]